MAIKILSVLLFTVLTAAMPQLEQWGRIQQISDKRGLITINTDARANTSGWGKVQQITDEGAQITVNVLTSNAGRRPVDSMQDDVRQTSKTGKLQQITDGNARISVNIGTGALTEVQDYPAITTTTEPTLRPDYSFQNNHDEQPPIKSNGDTDLVAVFRQQLQGLNTQLEIMQQNLNALIAGRLQASRNGARVQTASGDATGFQPAGDQVVADAEEEEDSGE